MKVKLKYFIVGFIILLSSFVLSTSVIQTEPKTTLIEVVLDSSIVEEPTIVLERYPGIETKKVNHKLDSLLKRINKRHDFHGSILVAKKGKLIYQNQIGFADFRKKTKLNKESIFQLASVSKQFTAAEIGRAHV